MSLETWKAEFYPVPACDVKKKEALAHSLRKWDGLTKPILRKHGLVKEYDRISDGVFGMDIDARSCALCEWFLGPIWSDQKPCLKCPLYKARGGKSCDHDTGGAMAPYSQFTHNDNPHPMIRLIKKAIEQKDQSK